MTRSRCASRCPRLFSLATLLPATLAPGITARGDCELAWRTVESPSPGGETNGLAGVTGTGDNAVWAVGSYADGGGRQTLVMRFDGVNWTTVPSENGTRQHSILARAAAVDPDDAWAVGFSTDGDQSDTLALHWDGRDWKAVSTPNVKTEEVDIGPYPVSNELLGISVAAKDDIWAVGRSYTIVTGQALIEHWDGKEWKIVESDHPGGFSGYSWLKAVVAVSKDDAWAFGDYYNDGLQQTLIERWDGKKWTAVESPNSGPFLNTLYAASGSATDDIWAVGHHQSVLGIDQVYQLSTFHWDGVAWSEVPIRSLTPENNYLFGVAALSQDEAYAVGFFDTGGDFPELHTLVEHWDGVEWAPVTTENPGSTSEFLDVAVIFPDDIWAVGDTFKNGFYYETLTERFSAACPPAEFLRGDANGDGKADLSDAVTTLHYLFTGGETPRCLDALDADDSGKIEITDAIYLLGFLFRGSLPLPPPFPDKGTDPTGDAFGCGG